MKNSAKSLFVISLLICLACSCKNKEYHVPYYDSSETTVESDVVSVPFKEEYGVKTVQVEINSCAAFPMILDTGCSGMHISVLEVYVLAKQGHLSAEDIEGYQYSQIADGSIIENMVINLKEVRIGDLVCHNVKATVSDNPDVPILLGNGVLDEVESIHVNNYDKTVEFKLK